MTVRHEVTLVFYERHSGGAFSVVDVVKTSRRFAYGFISRNLRAVYRGMPIATHVSAIAPGANWTIATLIRPLEA